MEGLSGDIMERNLAGEGMPDLTEHKNWCGLGGRMQLYDISILAFFGFQHHF